MTATLRTEPDLTLYLVIHRGMRRDADRLARAVTAVAPGDTRRPGAIARWYEGFLTELHHHHTIEDEIFFPALQERVPVLDQHLARIDRDHVRLTELLDRTDASLAGLVDGSSWTKVHGEAVAATTGLAELLRTHLDFEDDDVLPLFTRHFSGEEYEALDQRALKSVELRSLLFTIPWAMDAADATERAVMLDGAPAAFKLLWYVRRGAYARLSSRAFGEVA